MSLPLSWIPLSAALLGGSFTAPEAPRAPVRVLEELAPACNLGRARAGTRVLVFSKTAGYRHSAIAQGITAVNTLATRHGFAVQATEDPSVFTDAGLRPYSAVVFLNTTGNVLDSAQQVAFQKFIRRGNGFVGVHAAADTEYDWPWYGELVGAYFRSHPAVQQGTLTVTSRGHLATRCLEPTWNRRDEWYDFKALPPKGVNILMMLDERTYTNGRMGDNHPVAWYRRFDGGRAFYTALGHTEEGYAEPAFLNHLAGGILWAAAR